jgi:hypothetical protein
MRQLLTLLTTATLAFISGVLSGVLTTMSLPLVRYGFANVFTPVVAIVAVILALVTRA